MLHRTDVVRVCSVDDARKLDALETVYKALQPLNSSVHRALVVFGGSRQQVKLFERVILPEQGIESVEESLHLTAHRVIVNGGREYKHVRIFDDGEQNVHTIVKNTFSALDAGKTAYAEFEIYISEVNHLHGIARFRRALFELLGKGFRVSAPAERRIDYKHVFHMPLLF